MVWSHEAEVAIRRILLEYWNAPDCWESECQRLQAVPLFTTIGASVFVRPNGEVILDHWDGPTREEVRTDRGHQLGALYVLSFKHPDLKRLLPTRSADCIDCDACVNLVIPRRPGEFCGKCGGLGWLPEKPCSI